MERRCGSRCGVAGWWGTMRRDTATAPMCLGWSVTCSWPMKLCRCAMRCSALCEQPSAAAGYTLAGYCSLTHGHSHSHPLRGDADDALWGDSDGAGCGGARVCTVSCSTDGEHGAARQQRIAQCAQQAGPPLLRPPQVPVRRHADRPRPPPGLTAHMAAQCNPFMSSHAPLTAFHAHAISLSCVSGGGRQGGGVVVSV